MVEHCPHEIQYSKFGLCYFRCWRLAQEINWKYYAHGSISSWYKIGFNPCPNKKEKIKIQGSEKCFFATIFFFSSAVVCPVSFESDIYFFWENVNLKIKASQVTLKVRYNLQCMHNDKMDLDLVSKIILLIIQFTRETCIYTGLWFCAYLFANIF